MDPDSLSRPLQVLRWCLHLLVAALLALAAGRAVADHVPDAASVVAASAAVAILYAAGPALRPVRRSHAAAAAWLTVVVLGWGGLLWLTPDATWLAFPLLLLELHLLPPRWGTVAVPATTAAAIAGVMGHRGVSAAAAIGPVIGAAVAVATVLGYRALYQESDHRRRLIEQLTETRADLAAAERTAGMLAERERLAREIHDTLAQGLSSIQLQLRAAQRLLPGGEDTLAAHVEQARRTAQENLGEARRFVRALAPPDLAASSLPSALRRLCSTTAERGGPAVTFQLDGEPAPLPTSYEVALLRVAQSALANSVQHAGAGRVQLTLGYLDADVTLDVVDDGIGFDPEGAGGHGGFGLTAMRSRTGELGGTFAVESAPGEGTAVTVRFPLPLDTSTTVGR